MTHTLMTPSNFTPEATPTFNLYCTFSMLSLPLQVVAHEGKQHGMICNASHPIFKGTITMTWLPVILSQSDFITVILSQTDYVTNGTLKTE